MNFRQKKNSVLRDELKKVGLKWSEAKQLDKHDKRILFVIGKLLINYPVSFSLDFIRKALGIGLGTQKRSQYLIDAYSTYWQELEARERA